MIVAIWLDFHKICLSYFHDFLGGFFVFIRFSILLREIRQLLRQDIYKTWCNLFRMIAVMH